MSLLPTPQSNAVPARYQGVWRRTLLRTPERSDTTTTAFWMQTAHWHADLRIPAGRPDFTDVGSLAGCSAAQRDWLAIQQGFAGTTEVTSAMQQETCAWHRLVDFQPPSLSPDAGVMQFEPSRLVESGIHGAYLEHWARVSGSTGGFAVLECLREAETAPPAPRLLLVAGEQVMHVRARPAAWPGRIAAGISLSELVAAGRPDLLDFEVSFGRRTADGWRVVHSSFPWLEQRTIRVQLTKTSARQVRLCWDGVPSDWRIREWRPPAAA